MEDQYRAQCLWGAGMRDFLLSCLVVLLFSGMVACFVVRMPEFIELQELHGSSERVAWNRKYSK